jgi:hypothetical protein
MEDYGGFIPTAQDFLQEIEWQEWMNNGKGVPASHRKLNAHKSIKPGFRFDKD